MNLSGPDVPEIWCYEPDGCCGPDVCNVTEEQFVCAIRSLLPEGEPWNNTRKYIPSTRDPASLIGCAAIGCGGVIDGGAPPNKGTTMVGCSMVGCEQLVFGGCCDDAIPCEDEPPLAPQLAVVDSFAAVAYSAVQVLCVMLRELDPCTAKYTIRCWAERMGIHAPDPCGPDWSDEALAVLICLWVRLRFEIWNWESLQRLAALFGVCLTLREAGRFNCDYGPAQSWAGWTLSRDLPVCPPPQSCPPGPIPADRLVRLVPTCFGPPLSLNIIVCENTGQCPPPTPNCNLPPRPSTQPPVDPAKLFDVFMWLLPQVLPPTALWCVYKCDPNSCVA
jgi:hypothetical protein